MSDRACQCNGTLHNRHPSPIIADEAHARGLRVSGHVPAFMIAQQFVAAGTDEIQHLNFIVLNFLGTKCRTPASQLTQTLD
jgi:hypothetical protein